MLPACGNKIQRKEVKVAPPMKLLKSPKEIPKQIRWKGPSDAGIPALACSPARRSGAGPGPVALRKAPGLTPPASVVWVCQASAACFAVSDLS